jgi:hypothetical protein
VVKIIEEGKTKPPVAGHVRDGTSSTHTDILKPQINIQVLDCKVTFAEIQMERKSFGVIPQTQK